MPVIPAVHCTIILYMKYILLSLQKHTRLFKIGDVRNVQTALTHTSANTHSLHLCSVLTISWNYTLHLNVRTHTHAHTYLFFRRCPQFIPPHTHSAHSLPKALLLYQTPHPQVVSMPIWTCGYLPTDHPDTTHSKQCNTTLVTTCRYSTSHHTWNRAQTWSQLVEHM